MSLIKVSRDDRGVVTVTLADEANRNALSRALLSELNAALDSADADPDVRVVVLTNTGSVFCAGADLSEMSTNHQAASATSSVGAASVGAASGSGEQSLVGGASELFGRFRRSPKPYVGAIAGHCVAGGMGLAAALDISIASEDSKFGFSEVRVGVAPAMISVICLPKMRHADAVAAFLRGSRFTAGEAADMGLINSAVPAEKLDAEVNAVVCDLLAGGPEALAACKQLLDRVPQMSFDDASAWTQQFSSELFASAEAAEGMAAFLNKRPPKWMP